MCRRRETLYYTLHETIHFLDPYTMILWLLSLILQIISFAFCFSKLWQHRMRLIPSQCILLFNQLDPSLKVFHKTLTYSLNINKIITWFFWSKIIICVLLLKPGNQDGIKHLLTLLDLHQFLATVFATLSPALAMVKTWEPSH